MQDSTNSAPTNATGALRLKSYFSGTVEAALDLARRELGEEALLVNARPATAETRRYGAYEVVFGVPSSTRTTPPPLPLQNESDSMRTLTEQVAELHSQFQRLLQNESPPTPAAAPNVQTDATLGHPGAQQAAVMIVGPPGAGKTSTVIKLAGRYGVHLNRTAHILTTDTYRVAAADQLQTLAAILGAGCDVVEPVVSLPQVIEEHSDKSVLLIDTPGFALNDLSQSLELVLAASACVHLDVHLVLPASMKTDDALRLAEGYSIFRPNKLIFTKLDETLDRSSMLEIAAQLNLPISFLSAGPRIPEDIEPATRRRLNEWLDNTGPSSAPLLHRRATA